jgi:hypothetical protein
MGRALALRTRRAKQQPIIVGPDGATLLTVAEKTQAGIVALKAAGIDSDFVAVGTLAAAITIAQLTLGVPETRDLIEELLTVNH